MLGVEASVPTRSGKRLLEKQFAVRTPASTRDLPAVSDAGLN
jgi:hypothetical protein